LQGKPGVNMTSLWIVRTISAAGVIAALSFTQIASAQATVSTQAQVVTAAPAQGPVYRVEVVERSIPAVSYRNRGSDTDIGFVGTSLMPKADGKAEVETRKGYIEIQAEFDDLKPAATLGPEYLTYVLWAITPDGRPNNLGEIILDGDDGRLNVTTELQAFGMMVTAEPYFAVAQPSDAVVLENILRDETRGNAEFVNAKYELLKRGTYAAALPAGSAVRVLDKKVPLDLYQARHALDLARAAGADQHASDTYRRAAEQLRLAETYHGKDRDSKMAITNARQAVQTAEDARLIALQRKEEARVAEERRIAAENTARATEQATLAESRAALEAERRKAAEQEAQRSATAKAEADAARAAAERARTEADLAAQRARIEREQAESARQQALAETHRLELERQRAESERQQAVNDRTAAFAQREAAERDAQAAREAVAKAERERSETRLRLQEQLNRVMETRESARGLIVNISDVLFDVDRSNLKPGAREKLAKVAGIVLAHPDLKLQVEGHTDSTGGDEYNQRLSESRADAVRSFLVQQGISSASISATGLGETRPVASNDTGAGRQMNRRVELVISGESINVPTQSSSLR
jgi:outer membrane protein OmpA-like peptidoglycan-associated protein